MKFVTARIAKVIIVAYVSKSAEQRRKQPTQGTRSSFVSRPRLLRCRDASRSPALIRAILGQRRRLDGPGKNGEKNTECLRAIWKYLSSRRLPHLLFISFLFLLCSSFPLSFLPVPLLFFFLVPSLSYIHTCAYVKIHYTSPVFLPHSSFLSSLFLRYVISRVYRSTRPRKNRIEERETSQRRAPF